jgi:hypothetical protein
MRTLSTWDKIATRRPFSGAALFCRAREHASASRWETKQTQRKSRPLILHLRRNSSKWRTQRKESYFWLRLYKFGCRNLNRHCVRRCIVNQSLRREGQYLRGRILAAFKAAGFFFNVLPLWETSSIGLSLIDSIRTLWIRNRKEKSIAGPQLKPNKKLPTFFTFYLANPWQIYWLRPWYGPK